MRSVETNTSKAGKKTYKVRYRHAGTQASQTFKVHAEAKRFAQLLDVYPKNPQRALDAMFEEQHMADVPNLDTVAADHIRLLTGIEDGTRLNYTRLWARTWGPLIGNLPVTHVGSDEIKEATNALAATYSAKSLKNQRGLLAAVCDRAVDKGFMPKNPTRGLRLPRAKESERKEMRILTDDELGDILMRTNAHYRLFVAFLAGMGCRYGEAVALQVQDVRLPDVHIRRALKWSPDNKRTIGAPKTPRSNRVIRVPSKLRAPLERAIEGKPGDALVFTAPKGGPIQHRTFWSDIWLPAVQHLSPRPRPHDLRHSHASSLLSQGRPILLVSRRLGHESASVTSDVYGHLMPDAQLAAAEAADAVFAGMVLELG